MASSAGAAVPVGIGSGAVPNRLVQRRLMKPLCPRGTGDWVVATSGTLGRGAGAAGARNLTAGSSTLRTTVLPMAAASSSSATSVIMA